MNVEISAFSEGNLDKYQFLTRKVLKIKPNALEKAKFEFSLLGKAFNIGLNKNVEGYQEEGVMKLLKDIRDIIGAINNNNDNDENDGNHDDNDNNNENGENDDDESEKN